MHRVSVYLNSLASRSNFSYWKENIEVPLFRSKISFHRPKNLSEFNNTLREDLKKNIDVIISVGGDGTVHSIIQQMVGQTQTGLLVIPAGTANDLANELGNTSYIRKVIQSVRSNDFKHIDLIRINNTFMATNGGIGLGGDVANKINKMRRKYPVFKKVMKIAGNSVYKVFTGLELLRPTSDYYSLRVESKEFSDDIKAAALLVNNQKMLGGQFKIAPDTANDDGQFNVTILTHPNRLLLSKAVLAISNNNFPENDPHIISFETSKIKIYNKNIDKIPMFFGDGEIIGRSEDVWSIDLLPKSLRVFSKTGNIEYESLKNEVFLQ